MFDKVSQAAETVAINVSRRAFLGRLGQGALVTAGVLGGIHLLAGKAQAAWCRTSSGGLEYCQPNQICTAQGCYTPTPKPKPKPKPHRS
jgi:hypothetical protein